VAIRSSNVRPDVRPRASPRRRRRPLLAKTTGRGRRWGWGWRRRRGRRRDFDGRRWGRRRRAARAVRYLGADARHQICEGPHVQRVRGVGEPGGEVPTLGRRLGAGRARHGRPQAECQEENPATDLRPRPRTHTLHGSPPLTLATWPNAVRRDFPGPAFSGAWTKNNGTNDHPSVTLCHAPSGPSTPHRLLIRPIRLVPMLMRAAPAARANRRWGTRPWV